MNPTRQRRADQTLILLALSPKQRKRAHEANPGLGSVPAYVVLCGQYGQLFGSASQCRSLYEWWRNQYLDALFASAFESASFPVDGYRSTPDLDAVLARAAAGADSQSDLGYIGLVDPEPDVAERRVPEAEVPLTPEASYQLTPRQARQRAKYQEREGRRLERLRGNTGRKRRSVKTWLLVTVVLVGGLIIIGSLGEDDNDTTVRSTTRPTTSATATRPTAPSGPSWCVHAEHLEAELILQERLMARHGDQTADWPSDDLGRFISSIDAQGQAAGRLWDQAPESYNWADVRRECGVNLPR